MSFLVNLAKRKKTPEQIVRLAIAALHELPPPEEAGGGVGGHEGEHGDKATASQAVRTGDEGASRTVAHSIGEHDELCHSGYPPSSYGSSIDFGGQQHGSFFSRTGSAGSEVGGRPAYMHSGSTSSVYSRLDSVNEYNPSHNMSSASMSMDTHEEKPQAAGGSKHAPSKIHGVQVPSMFMSDPGKRQTSMSSPHITALLQHAASLGPGGEEPTPLEKLAKRLTQMKTILYGSGDKEVDKEKCQMKTILYGSGDEVVDKEKCRELATVIIREGLFPLLMEHFGTLPFESRKDTAQIFNNLCRHNLGGFADPYIASQHLDVVSQLIRGYDHPEIALNCGAMLRECIRHDKIARRILFSNEIWLFFERYVHLPNFDVASDSFATLRELMTKHKALAAEFLEQNYDQVLDRYKALLRSENYVTRRMSLKLLGELLLDRSNFNVMMRFISSKENLKNIMNLLRDKSGSIQFEAFHVFKVFVANPKKPAEIVKILVTNKGKLMAYLENFHNEKDDDQFREEKALLISTLSKMEGGDAPDAETSER